MRYWRNESNFVPPAVASTSNGWQLIRRWSRIRRAADDNVDEFPPHGRQRLHKALRLLCNFVVRANDAPQLPKGHAIPR